MFIDAVLVVSTYILFCPVHSLVRFYKVSALCLVLLDRARTSAEQYVTVTMTTYSMTTPATQKIDEVETYTQGKFLSILELRYM